MRAVRPVRSLSQRRPGRAVAEGEARRGTPGRCTPSARPGTSPTTAGRRRRGGPPTSTSAIVGGDLGGRGARRPRCAGSFGARCGADGCPGTGSCARSTMRTSAPPARAASAYERARAWLRLPAIGVADHDEDAGGVHARGLLGMAVRSRGDGCCWTRAVRATSWAVQAGRRRSGRRRAPGRRASRRTPARARRRRRGRARRSWAVSESRMLRPAPRGDCGGDPARRRRGAGTRLLTAAFVTPRHCGERRHVGRAATSCEDRRGTGSG